MGTLPYCLFTLCILLGFINGFVYSDTPGGLSAVVVGQTECLDCAHKNIKAENAFDGLRVAIKCKVQDGMYETKAVGKLDAGGSFKVKLPAAEILHDGGSLKHESCFAQLHGAADTPCPDEKNGLIPTAKIVLQKSKEDQTKDYTFVVEAGKLSFSSATCVSAFLWSSFPPHPTWHPLHKYFPWKKSFPKFPLHPIYKPPVPVYQPPAVPKSSVPVYKPPVIPKYKSPVPVYKPSVPVYKPPEVPKYKPSVPIYKSPSVPKYKPSVPIYKPSPMPKYKPSVPIYKSPVSTPKVPVYKPPMSPPKIPIYKKPFPPIPLYKPKPKFSFPPIYKKPLPPFPFYKPKPKFSFPPIYKKPLPPIPKLPPFYQPKPKFSFPPIYKKPLPPFPPVKGWPQFPPATWTSKP